MKPHERRAAAAYPYFKLATWDVVSLTWRDGKVQFNAAEDALTAAKSKPGRYRISAVIDERTRDDLAPFTIGTPSCPDDPNDGSIYHCHTIDCPTHGERNLKEVVFLK